MLDDLTFAREVVCGVDRLQLAAQPIEQGSSFGQVRFLNVDWGRLRPHGLQIFAQLPGLTGDGIELTLGLFRVDLAPAIMLCLRCRCRLAS